MTSSVAQNEMERPLQNGGGGLDCEVEENTESHVASTEDSSSSSASTSGSSSSSSGSSSSSSEEADSSNKTSDEKVEKVEQKQSEKPLEVKNGDGGFTKDGEFDYKPRKVREKNFSRLR